MKVTFSDCHSELVKNGGPGARKAFDEWRRRPGYQQVVDFVRGFDHEKIYALTPDDIRTAVKNTDHALGDVPAKDQIREIEDFTCPFALQHLFHHFVEQRGYVPTWQRFFRWMNKQAKPYWLDQIQPLCHELNARYSEKRINDAIRWRLGKFYYSALREVDFLVWMHTHGVKLKYHLLADVLLRTDYWMEQTILCTFAPNPRYRSEGEGRKNPAEVYFRDAAQPFNIIDFEVQHQGFGKVWLTKESSKLEILKLLEQAHR